MNNIITLRNLAALLAKATSTDQAFAERFLIDFTQLIADSLAINDSVRIKGFGQFRRIVVAGKSKIEFSAEKEIADYINAPFGAFEAVELADEVSADMLEEAVAMHESETVKEPDQATKAPEAEVVINTIATEAEPEPVEPATIATEPEPQPTEPEVATEPEPQPTEPEVVTEPEVATEPEQQPTEPEVATEPEPEPQPTEPEVAQEASTVEATEISVDYDEADDEADYDGDDNFYGHDRHFPWFWIATTLILGILLGFAVGYFCHDEIALRTYGEQVEPQEDEGIDFDTISVDTISPTEADTLTQQQEAQVVPAQESTIETPEQVTSQEIDTNRDDNADNVVYETISPNHSLTSMAREHYGSKDYWVYIFMENSDIISNPNNVKAGMRLRIPPREKYDVSKDEKENLKAAKEKAREFFNKYYK